MYKFVLEIFFKGVLNKGIIILNHNLNHLKQMDCNFKPQSCVLSFKKNPLLIATIIIRLH